MIVPPAKTVEEAEQRLKEKEHECDDRWFCHKPNPAKGSYV